MENQEFQQLNKFDRKKLRHQQKLEEKNSFARKRKVKSISKMAFIVLIVAGIIGAFVWYVVNLEPIPEEDIITTTGIHRHPQVSILIHGAPQKIPASFGIGVIEQKIHTHDTSGTLHVEMGGLVTKKDIEVNEFFRLWGRQFNSECIFEFCNGPEGTVTMTVNREPSVEFENYLMQDGDRIEIRYEKSLSEPEAISEPTPESISEPTPIPEPEPQGQQISMNTGNFFFSPKSLVLNKDQPVKITFSNSGTHTFSINELGINRSLSGSVVTVEFTPTKSGTFEYYCAVPGHRGNGMFGSLTVE